MIRNRLFDIALLLTIGIANAYAAPADKPQTGLPATGGNATAMTDIHDIKPVLALEGQLTWLYWVLAALALVGLLALAWYMWKRRQKPQTAVPAAVVISPDQEAYQALDALAAETGLAPKQFYFRLSAVVRLYTERRFEFPAAEMTTEELLPRVDRLPLAHDLAADLKAFCRIADPIKFADAPAERERMTHDLVFARDFVRQTTAALRSENEDESTAGPDPSMEMASKELKQLPLKGERQE